MTTDKSSARRARFDAERVAAQQREKQRKVAIGAVVFVFALVAAGLAFLLLTRDDDEDDVATSTSTTVTTAVEPAEPAEAAAFTYGSGACPPEAKPAEPLLAYDDAPQRCLTDGVDYGAVVTTSEGAFTIDLLEERAPGTVNNFVVLARNGYFDGDDFHRIVPGFVNQAGDPVGEPPGTGDPGYAIADELPADVSDYVEGAVAMANSGPDTNGSQFFVCVGCSSLPSPDYSLFGQVTEGLDVSSAINALGQADQTSSRPVTITSVEITEA